MDDTGRTRRKLLQVTGSAALLGLAGCTAGGSQDGGETTAASHDTTADGHDDEHTETGSHDDEEPHDDGEHTESGSGHGHGHTSVPEGPSAIAEVHMTSTSEGEHFDPHVVWIEAGGTLRFKNESGAHSTIAYAPANDKPQRIPDGAEAFESDLFSEEGATFEVTLDTPGVYDYYCEPHEAVGMIGSVIVGEPDAHGQPGLAEPQDEFPDPVARKITELNEMCNEALGHTH